MDERETRTRRRGSLASALGVCALAIVGCHRGAPARANAFVEPPVPPPDKRLGDLVIATPDALWSKLQKGIGGAASLLPSTFGGVVCATTGLDLAFAPEIDGNAPAYGELAEGEQGPVFAFAIKLVDARRARDALVDSDTPRFGAQEDGAITRLVPNRAHEGPSLALTKNGFLLVAHDDAALHALGPYAYRTLPTQPLPPHALLLQVPRDALAGAVHDGIAHAWDATREAASAEDATQRAQHGGRDPDFGDAAAILATANGAVQSALLVEADLESARIGVDADDDAVHLDLTLTPKKGDGPASQALGRMRPGDPSPLASLPADTTLGVLFRDDTTTRTEDGAAVEASILRALGPRLHDADAKELHEAVVDWSTSRGDWLAAGLSVVGGVSVRALTPAPIADKATRAVREIVGLATLPAFADPLRSLLGIQGIVLTDATIPGVAHAAVATFARETPPAGARRGGLPLGAHLGMAWGVVDQDLRVVAGEDARALLAPAASTKTLAADARVTAALRALGNEVSFALLAQPFGPGATDAGPALVLGWGRRAGEAWGRADIQNALLHTLVSRQTGL
jgi:hypothetical protein